MESIAFAGLKSGLRHQPTRNAPSIMRPSASASLFGDEPPTGSSLTGVLAQHKPANRAQKTFQQLVGRIETKREQLRHWQAYLPRYNRRIDEDLEPSRQRLREGQRKMVGLIDELLSLPRSAMRWTRLERAKLGQLLTGMAGGLLAESGDAVLEGLYDKYSGVSYRQVLRSQVEMTESMLSEVFGLEIDGEHGAASTEELLELAQKQMAEQFEEEERLAELRQQARAAKNAKAGTAKADAVQSRREQAAKEVGKSLREVYRKLASALHPDREPDVQERQRKTHLMQRVNQAYDANDLLTLLGLQLEIEQIDAAHMASVSPQRLAHYNQILREQLAELEAELERCVEPFRGSVGPMSKLTPDNVDREMGVEIARIELQTREVVHDLTAFRNPNYLRQALKLYPLEADFVDREDLAGLFDVPAPVQPLRAGKKRRRN